MKVLFLFDDYSRFNHRLFKGFVSKLADFCDFNIYGPKEHERNPKVAPIKYDNKITSKDLVGLFNPDIFLFQIYNKKAIEWYPKDICKAGIPSALIVNDHYTRNKDLQAVDKEEIILNWCENSGLSLLIHKHFHEEKEVSIPSVWLPPSANENEFYPDKGIERKNEIVFSGSSDSGKYYWIRHNARSTLKGKKLLTDKGKVASEEYPRLLRSYTGALACSGGILHTPLTKTFEITLSGTALLTNRMHEARRLFGRKRCFFVYRDDLSDIGDIAKVILNDRDMVEEVTANALEVVRKNHTDIERIKELYYILYNLMKGKDIPRVWGR